MAAGGVLASAGAALGAAGTRRQGLPRDMNTASLLGGGLIAGDALAALAIGMAGLLSVS